MRAPPKWAMPTGGAAAVELAVVDDNVMVALIAGIAGDDSEHRWSRAQWMDSVTDQLGEYSDEQATRLAVLLADLALAEADPQCREAALHAVAELVVWHPVDKAHLRRLCDLRTERLSQSEQEYLEWLCG